VFGRGLCTFDSASLSEVFTSLSTRPLPPDAEFNGGLLPISAVIISATTTTALTPLEHNWEALYPTAQTHSIFYSFQKRVYDWTVIWTCPRVQMDT
jgi:hypothetical protein